MVTRCEVTISKPGPMLEALLGESLQGATQSSQGAPRAPRMCPDTCLYFFIQLLQGPERGTGDREEQRKRPCPSSGPCYLLLLFPTRQMGVPSHHPNRPQATKTPKASSSVAASQVSSDSPCLPPPPATPSDPSILPLLERGCLSHSVVGKDSSLGKGIEAFLRLPNPASLCPLSQRGTAHWLLGAAFRAGY